MKRITTSLSSSAINESLVSKAIRKAKAARPLNALISETFELAQMQESKALNDNLEAFTLVVKDTFAVKDLPLTCASAALDKGFIAPYTSTCVQRLVDRGGCLIGKANMDEFAMGSSSAHSIFGAVKNSIHFERALKYLPNSISEKEALEDDWHIAGGSSGGSAVAVALGIARVALGSDTGGSTRNPAAFNGVFGFKPSYGVLSRHGLVSLANSFDSPSILTNSISDAQYFFEMMRGRDEMDSTSVETHKSKMPESRTIKIGIPLEFRNDFLSEESLECWKSAQRAFESIGFEVVDVSLPNTVYSIVAYHILAESDIASNMARYDGVRYGSFGDENAPSFDQMITETRTSKLNYSVKRRIFAGNYFNIKENRGKYYLQAAKVRRLIKNDFDRVFKEEKMDAILTPVTSHSAPLYSQIRTSNFRDQQRKDDFYTQPVNMAGLPAISIPWSKCSSGLPLGVQLICDYLNDDLCLELSKILFENKIIKY